VGQVAYAQNASKDKPAVAAIQPAVAPAAAPATATVTAPAAATAPAADTASATAAAPATATGTAPAADTAPVTAAAPATAAAAFSTPATLSPATSESQAAAPPSVAAEPAAEAFPKKLSIGNSGWLQVGALMQAWFVVEDGKAIADNPAGGQFDTTAYFRFRRTQIILFGDIVRDLVSYSVLFDLAKTLSFTQIPATGTATGYKPQSDAGMLYDYSLTMKSCIADVSIGQYRSTMSYEGASSSSVLLLPERAFTSRYFGDNYDAGMRAEKKFDYVKYAVYVLQGMPAANMRDNNRQKEVALRLEFTPLKGIVVGGAGLTSVGQRATQDSTRDIIEADAVVDLYDFTARGELLWGWSGRTDGSKERTKSRGMMASLGYTIAKKVQPIVRLSYLDIDVTTDGTPTGQPLYSKFGLGTDEIRGYELGVNYYLDGKFAKLQAAYGYFDMDSIPYRQQFILSGQVAL
jgi:hypothetical protein